MSQYADPRSLRQAINSRLGVFAEQRLGRTPHDLSRQFAYDRLLARVFSSVEADRWVLKGSTALLARVSGVARHTRDIDLYREGTADYGAAERGLRDAATIDLGDFFRFTLGRASAVAGARRIKVDAFLGATIFSRFPVDIMTGLVMTAEPDFIDPPLPEIPGIQRVQYRAYPLSDHIADKVCALHELHQRGEAPDVPSTRYRDLVDLVLIARTLSVDAPSLIIAVRSEAARRGLALPATLAEPSGYGWESGYQKLARSLPGFVDLDIQSAVATVGALVNPVLSGTATGAWDYHLLSWLDEV